MHHFNTLVTSHTGFGVSMLKRIADSHPESIAPLTYQYRMHEEICQLSNDLVYGGQLKCANDQIRRRRLDLASFPENIPSQTSSQWLRSAVDPAWPVVFLNTDEINQNAKSKLYLERTSGRTKGGSIVNDTEASLVRIVVTTLLSCGLDPPLIGVVCPFRAQVR